MERVHGNLGKLLGNILDAYFEQIQPRMVKKQSLNDCNAALHYKGGTFAPGVWLPPEAPQLATYEAIQGWCLQTWLLKLSSVCSNVPDSIAKLPKSRAIIPMCLFRFVPFRSTWNLEQCCSAYLSYMRYCTPALGGIRIPPKPVHTYASAQTHMNCFSNSVSSINDVTLLAHLGSRKSCRMSKPYPKGPKGGLVSCP